MYAKVLVLTHSNIQTDSRILKTISAIKEIDFIELHGYGIEDNFEKHVGKMVPELVYNLEIKNSNSAYKKGFFWTGKIKSILYFFKLTYGFYSIGKRIKPQIVHANDWPSLLSAVLLKLRFGTKVIYDAHELESQTNGLSKIMSKLIITYEKILWSKIDFLINPSIHCIDWYIKNIGYKDNQLILNSPILSTELKSEINLCDYEINLKADMINFIYVGILGEGRGIRLLLDLFQSLDIYNIYFLGYGSLKELVTEYSINNDNIYYIKPIPHECVTSFVANFDYGFSLIENVSLSDYFSAPNKLFEYAFSGIPVIASNFPEMEYYVNNYKLGYTSELDITNLTNLLKSLKKSRSRIETGHLNEISWENQKMKIKEIYNNYLSRNV